jgi:hypothetical protein
MKLVAPWTQVAAIEARICQVRAPFWILLPQEILRAMTAGRPLRGQATKVGEWPTGRIGARLRGGGRRCV